MAAPMRLSRTMQCQSLIFNIRRYLLYERYISTCMYMQNDILKSRRMRKLLAKQPDTRVGHMQIKVPIEKIAAGPKPKKVYRKLTAGNQRRMKQIGVIYEEHIAQIMADEEVDVEVDIVKIQVMYDMGSINVYWAGKDDIEQDNSTQQLLDEKAGYIRHLLHSRNILGYIPKIVFVKDLSAAKEEKLNEIFTRLNLGSLMTPEDNNESTVINKDQDKSTFRQDIYGLQHDVLMQKVVDAKHGKPPGPKVVVMDIEDDIMTKLARREYVQKVSKHLKGEKLEKKKEKRIKDYIAQSYENEMSGFGVENVNELEDACNSHEDFKENYDDDDGASFDK